MSAKLNDPEDFYELGKLAAGIFHDLSNPLTTLILNLDQAILTQHELKRQLYLSRAMQSSKQIKRLLDIAIWQIKDQKHKKTKFDPIKEIRASFDLLQEFADKHHIKFVLKARSNVPKLYGNSVKFSQIINNIVCNAIEAYEDTTKRNIVLIELLSRKSDLMIHISNWGKPIRNNMKGQIFQAFNSQKLSTKKNLGLGLFIASDLIENEFKGKIYLENQSHKTTFKLYFPIKNSLTYSQNP